VDELGVLQERFLKRGAKGVDGVAKGGFRRGESEGSTAADVEQGDIKKICLPGVWRGNDSGVGRVTLKGVMDRKIGGRSSKV